MTDSAQPPETAGFSAMTLVALTGDTALATTLRAQVAERPLEPIDLVITGNPDATSKALSSAGDRGAALYDLRGGGSTHHNLLSAIPIISRSGPVIGLVDTESSQIAQAALAAGAIDVIAVGDLSAVLLRRALRYALARRESERKLTRLRLFDPVTNLASQILFWEILSLAVRRAKRNRDFFAILLVDIENLPDGHSEDGPYLDLALRELAERITPILRGSDTIAPLAMPETPSGATYTSPPRRRCRRASTNAAARLAPSPTSNTFAPRRRRGSRSRNNASR